VLVYITSVGTKQCTLSRTLHITHTLQVQTNPQPQRAAPPDSVTTDKDMSNKNVYRLTFDAQELTLPLQTPFAPTTNTPLTNGSSSSGGVLVKTETGDTVYRGAAVRHGCNQRVRELWKETLLQVGDSPS
jgi:hypothetical protein